MPEAYNVFKKVAGGALCNSRHVIVKALIILVVKLSWKTLNIKTTNACYKL